MRNDLSRAIRLLASERSLPEDVVMQALEAAIIAAYRKTPEAWAQNVRIGVDSETNESKVYAQLAVVEEVQDDRSQVSLEEAKKIDPDAELGEVVEVDVTPKDFGRIAAQTAKQVILQRIREAEREATYHIYADREGEIVHGIIRNSNPDGIAVGLDKAEALLPRANQIPTEQYSRNRRIRVYVQEVRKTPRGPEIIVSRTHKRMLRRLMELEVPEIFNGAVEIKAIAREAGSRSKVAVAARQEGVDPVGACVGIRGVRIQALVNELSGEKIDVVAWDPDPSVFIANALSPAQVTKVRLVEAPEGRTAEVVVPDRQLSLAIGKEGQNARLAAKLTGWRIDIKSEAEAAEEALHRMEEEAERAKKRKELEDAQALLAEAEAKEHEEAEVAELAEETETLEGAVEPEEPAAPEAVAEEEPEVEPAAPEAVAEEEPEVEPEAPEAVAEEEPEVEPAAPEAVAEEEPEVEPEAPVETEAEPEPVPEPEEAVAETEPEVVEVAHEVEQAQEEDAEVAEKAPAEEERTEADWQQLAKEDEAFEELEEPTQKGKKKRQQRQLVYDEDLGEVIARKRRKPGRRRERWERDLEHWEDWAEDLDDSDKGEEGSDGSDDEEDWRQYLDDGEEDEG